MSVRDLKMTLVTATALFLTVACDSAATAQPTAIQAPVQVSPTPQPTPANQVQRTPQVLRVENILPKLTLQRVYPDQDFTRLTNLAQAGDRIFVTEQTGRIFSLPVESGIAEAEVLLDIRSQVSDAGNEEGLLGLAIDPDYADNGHYYVYYSAAQPRRSVISRVTARDPDSELVILEVLQSYSNHNGGQLAFGPDSMLYISLGDGGSGGDPQGNGQDLSTLLGSILRIDVSGIGPDRGYDVPPDNPFVGVRDAREEIWAYGLRIPGDSLSTAGMGLSGPETSARTVSRRST